MTRSTTQSLALPRDWWNFATYTSWQGLKRQYSRTKLGPWWVVLTQFTMIGGLGLVFSAVFNQPVVDYLPFISASIISWNLISPSITQSPTIFVGGYGIIQSFRLPFAIFPIQTLLNNIFVFLHSVVVHIGVLLAMGKPIWLVPYALLMACIVVVILYCIMSVLGVLGARFRDLGPAVGSVMMLMFLVTPVIFEKKILPPDRMWLATYNPFAHMLEIMRSPLIGNWPPTDSVIISLGIAVFCILGAEFVFRRYAKHLPFWV
jgi:lipopolysaccharide transport system permease protein